MQMADLRNVLRTLLHSPGFTFLAALLLAVGIGANAVIYGALDAILLRTLSARNPEQLVHMVQEIPRVGRRSGLPYSFYRNLKEHSATLSTAFGEEEMQVAMESPAPAEAIRVHLLTPEFFDALGATAVVGRTLTSADAIDSPGTPPAVLSYGFWRRRFNGDKLVVGRKMQLHGHAFIIVGVLARGFNGISIETAPDVCVPLRSAPLLQMSLPITPMESRYLDVGGRMKPGFTRARAQEEVRATWRRSIEGDPDAGTEPLELDSLEHGTSILRQKFSGALRLLIAAVGCCSCWSAPSSPACWWRAAHVAPTKSPSGWPSAPLVRGYCARCSLKAPSSSFWAPQAALRSPTLPHPFWRVDSRRSAISPPHASPWPLISNPIAACSSIRCSSRHSPRFYSAWRPPGPPRVSVSIACFAERARRAAGRVANSCWPCRSPFAPCCSPARV
jgi:hypothetical protein